jgi:hypothetical protein
MDSLSQLVQALGLKTKGNWFLALVAFGLTLVAVMALVAMDKGDTLSLQISTFSLSWKAKP